jgi:phosphopantetheinyl transferase (holo-ACP synthase)
LIVGNDIVALGAEAGRSGQPEFYTKIITPPEKRLHSTQRFPHLSFPHFVWLCWAVKEAAFKCVNRVQPGTLFWGPRIAITELSSLTEPPGESFPDTGENVQSVHHYSALARFNDQSFQAWVRTSDECILAVCLPGRSFSADSFAAMHWGVRRMNSTDAADQSAGVRDFLLEELQRRAPGQQFTIGKAPAGYPFIMNGEKQLDMGLSFSHHEEWISYAFA